MDKYRFSKILRVLFLATLIILCLLLLWALVLYVLGLHYQWWVRATILTCLGATLIVVFLLRKIWLKRREMKFIDGIIGPDALPGSVHAISDASRELRGRFKEAVATLKKSDLKRRGNPLYVLPWYLIVGKSGAGKSTAIKSARLPSPFKDINRIQGVEGTRNCDWWFFDDSVVIDIAGRYSVHHNEEVDRGEWLAFLEHLIKYRQKEPINGIIVTAEADQLIEANLEKIENEGRVIRKRINEVINVMGAKFPIYLLVTKCDLVFGMNRFCQLLSETSLEQAMGLMNHNGETDIAVFVNKTVDTLVDKLKDVRLILANKEEVRDRHFIEPEVLVFPDEFSRLRNGLIAFCKGAFKDNPFQELPIVRGIYFCSGQQVGRPILSQSGKLSTMPPEELPGTRNGFFLYDFFSKIMPADRTLYAITHRAKEWHRLTQNLWLTGFVTVVLIFSILLTHSWNENKAAVNQISPHFKKKIIFKNDLVSDIALMNDFGREILGLETLNKNWKFPRLGLFASVELEKILKKRYCARFHDHFDAQIPVAIEKRIVDDGWEKDNYKAAVDYIPFITRRINLLKARSEGADAEKLMTLPHPDYAFILSKEESTSHNLEILEGYKTSFINYLIWQKDDQLLANAMQTMQGFLRDYFHENQGSMKWLVYWANKEMQKKPVTMNDYWNSDASDADLPKVDSAFTVKGRQIIGKFMVTELEKAVEQPLWIAKSKADFVPWYKNTYYGRWMTFCQEFGEGLTLFKTSKDRLTVIEQLTSDESPYFSLIKTLETELTPGSKSDWPNMELAAEEDKPYHEWLRCIRNFGVIRKASAGDSVKDNKAVENMAMRASGRTRLAAEITKDALAASDMGKAKEAYSQYQKALGGFSGIATSTLQAYKVAREGFEDDPAMAASAIWAAQKAIDTFRKNMGKHEVGSDSLDSKDPFWGLLLQPVDLLWQFSVSRAGCHLQKLWDEEVLVETQGISDRHRLVELLFGNGGYVDKYTQNHARPFLSLNSRRGYHAETVRGCKIPFRSVYFNFIASGKKWELESGGVSVQSNYDITVQAFPTDVNVDAKVKPHMTQLIMQTAQGDKVLTNRQYPVEEKFKWSPSTSGDVTLNIMLGDIVLTKKYTGYCAFGKFLKDFKSGKKTFTGVDFPEYAPEFYRMGVREIEVLYRFQGSQISPIIKMLKSSPGSAPTNIVKCAD